MNAIPISYPGRYAPGVAVNFADANGAARQVSESSPLPVALAAAPAGTPAPAPLAGSATAATTAGPLAAVSGKPLILTLGGTWSGSVRLLRSVDGGTTRVPLSLGGAPWGTFTGNVCEPVWDETEDAVTFYLQLAPASGEVEYPLVQ
jgi:hypothetical protein